MCKSAAQGNKNVHQLQIGCIKGCLSFNEAQDVSFSDPVASILKTAVHNSTFSPLRHFHFQIVLGLRILTLHRFVVGDVSPPALRAQRRPLQPGGQNWQQVC